MRKKGIVQKTVSVQMFIDSVFALKGLHKLAQGQR